MLRQSLDIKEDGSLKKQNCLVMKVCTMHSNAKLSRALAQSGAKQPEQHRLGQSQADQRTGAGQVQHSTGPCKTVHMQEHAWSIQTCVQYHHQQSAVARHARPMRAMRGCELCCKQTCIAQTDSTHQTALATSLTQLGLLGSALPPAACLAAAAEPRSTQC